ncbi:hypothetical protein Ancab_029697 [Ancistrocladus abbreviatus]
MSKGCVLCWISSETVSQTERQRTSGVGNILKPGNTQERRRLAYFEEHHHKPPTRKCRMSMKGSELSHSEIVSRFNERFLLSLSSCKACLVMDDDELNDLPIVSHAKSSIVPLGFEGVTEPISKMQEELKNLKELLHGVLPVECSIMLPMSLQLWSDAGYDNYLSGIVQGKSVSTFLDAILDKGFQRTIALTASRRRGKSAALGYSSIFEAAPSPDDLKLLFEFIRKVLHAFNFKV